MKFQPGFYVHEMPARSIDHVIDYLSAEDSLGRIDSHAQSKVHWFDGDKFTTVSWQFPIDLRKES